MNQIKQARALARIVHKGQRDKAGNPYFGHADRVAKTARSFAIAYGIRKKVAAKITTVGYLHDVVEDSNTSLADLRKMGFSEDVVEAVSVMTHEKRVPYGDYVEAASQHDLAKWVKLADVVDHLTRNDWQMPESFRKKYTAALEVLAKACYTEVREDQGHAAVRSVLSRRRSAASSGRTRQRLA